MSARDVHNELASGFGEVRRDLTLRRTQRTETNITSSPVEALN